MPVSPQVGKQWSLHRPGYIYPSVFLWLYQVQVESQNAQIEVKKKIKNQHFICIIYLVAMNGCCKKIFPLLFDSFPLFVSRLTNNKALQQTVLQTNIWHCDLTHIQAFKD